MATTISSDAPDDPVGRAAVDVIGEIVSNVDVEVIYARDRNELTGSTADDVARAVGDGPPGWAMSVAVRLDGWVAGLTDERGDNPVAELLTALPAVVIAAAAELRPDRPTDAGRISANLRRAVRDTVGAELLAGFVAARVSQAPKADLLARTIDYLLELSSTRVEAHALTHGVLFSDFLVDTPSLVFDYPDDLRSAKRAPLLFDGQRSVLVVDSSGRARTEIEFHRLDRFEPLVELSDPRAQYSLDGGLLVAEATRRVGGVGLYLRADRSLWVFADGEPVLVRRGERWTAFPIQLAAAIANNVGGVRAASLVAHAAFIVSAQDHGAILAIVGDPSVLDDVVPAKDRYDQRFEVAVDDMRPETRLHHLIDAEPLDERTLARLASLDGATVLDLDGHLITYGAIVTSVDSEQEGARTAAARTLSVVADIVLKISVDGDITIFRDGAPFTTLLSSRPHH